jgi:hypothetical protein
VGANQDSLLNPQNRFEIRILSATRTDVWVYGSAAKGQY